MVSPVYFYIPNIIGARGRWGWGGWRGAASAFRTRRVRDLGTRRSVRTMWIWSAQEHNRDRERKTRTQREREITRDRRACNTRAGYLRVLCCAASCYTAFDNPQLTVCICLLVFSSYAHSRSPRALLRSSSLIAATASGFPCNVLVHPRRCCCTLSGKVLTRAMELLLVTSTNVRRSPSDVFLSPTVRLFPVHLCPSLSVHVSFRRLQARRVA